MKLNLNLRNFSIIIILIILLTNLSSILNIPWLRQIFGFIFLAFLPGILILSVLNMKKLDYLEKLVLCVGLSAAFVMIFGIILNFLPINKPLNNINVLIWFDLIYIGLILLNIKSNKNKLYTIIINLDFSTKDKFLTILPIIFVFLSIIGAEIFQINGSNIVSMMLLFSLAIYLVILAVYKPSNNIHVPIIYFFGLSLLLIFMLSFSHIAGRDVNIEFYIYKMTLQNLKWEVLLNGPYDSCLSISILPTIYQSIINFSNQELYFKSFYVFLFSFCPLTIYYIARKYVDEKYALFCSFFFISQIFFLKTAASPRTNTSIFFVGLFVMTLFNKNIEQMKKSIILILFMVSTILSHYSTAYIFFGILLSGGIASEIRFRKYKNYQRYITILLPILFIIIAFFWFGQITGMAFDKGVNFLISTVSSMNNMFIEDIREPAISKLAGQGLQNPILGRFELFFTISSFIIIGIGFITTIISYFKYKKFKELNYKFWNIEIEYLAMSFAGIGILVSSVVLPFVSLGYDIQRLYMLVLVFLSVFLIIGCIKLSKIVKLDPKILILFVLIPYFLFTSGFIHESFGIHRESTLNRASTSFEQLNILDSEIYGAKWLSSNALNANYYGVRSDKSNYILISQGLIHPKIIYLTDRFKEDNYMFLSSSEINNSSLINNLTNKSLIFDGGKSQIYY